MSMCVHVHAHVCICVHICLSVCVHVCVMHMSVCPLHSSSPEYKLPDSGSWNCMPVFIHIEQRVTCKVLSSLLLEISKHPCTQQIVTM